MSAHCGDLKQNAVEFIGDLLRPNLVSPAAPGTSVHRQTRKIERFAACKGAQTVRMRRKFTAAHVHDYNACDKEETLSKPIRCSAGC